MDPMYSPSFSTSSFSSSSDSFSMEFSTLPETTDRRVPEEGLEVDVDRMNEDTSKECVMIDNPPIPCHTEDPFNGGDQGAEREGYDDLSNPRSPGLSTSEQSEAAEKAKSRSRRRLLIWIGVGLVLLAIGGGVGGYFGWRATHQSRDTAALSNQNGTTTAATPESTSTASAASTGASSSAASATPSSIVANSPLTAVSFRTTRGGAPSGPQTGTVMVLAFKAPDGSMKASLAISSWGSVKGSNSSWQATPQSVTSPAPPENGTGFAMTGFASSTLKQDGNTSTPVYSVEFMVLYVNKTGFINGLKYIDTSAAAGTTQDKIDERAYSVKSGGNIAAYWPWVVFQDWSGFINVANSLADPAYSNKALKTVGIEGTNLAVVPLSTKYAKITNSSYGIFYQMATGQLAATIPGTDVWGSEDPTASWPSTSSFPNITLPARASFAAFSFARSNNSDDDTVTTYVLYQDESASIKQVWTDDSKTWQQSSPAALAVADYGTNIACMTPSASNDTYGLPLDVTPQSNLTRCYFQRGGWPIEVQLNGTEWVDLGRLPMP